MDTGELHSIYEKPKKFKILIVDYDGTLATNYTSLKDYCQALGVDVKKEQDIINQLMGCNLYNDVIKPINGNVEYNEELLDELKSIEDPHTYVYLISSNPFVEEIINNSKRPEIKKCFDGIFSTSKTYIRDNKLEGITKKCSKKDTVSDLINQIGSENLDLIKSYFDGSEEDEELGEYLLDNYPQITILERVN